MSSSVVGVMNHRKPVDTMSGDHNTHPFTRLSHRELSPAMKVLGIDHVQLAMPPGGEEQARIFYAEVLGLQEVAKPPALLTHGGCWFRGPRTEIHLGVQDPHLPATKAHPGFLVADLEEARHRFLAADVEVIVDHSVPAVRHFYVKDPFGNRLEFIQKGDGFSEP